MCEVNEEETELVVFGEENECEGEGEHVRVTVKVNIHV